jgi:hypothetical protein
MAAKQNESPASWGPPPLTSRPEGLLSSLGIQSGGMYPQHLENNLQGTYELGPWYREHNQVFRSGVAFNSGGAIAAGTLVPTTIEVPSGEIWIVNRLGVHFECTIAAAVTLAFALVRTNNANGNQLLIDRVDATFSVGNMRVVSLGMGQLPILLRPTVRLQVYYLGGNTLNQPTLANGNANVAYTRCEIGSPA